jgi:hypothetical protein
VAADQHERDEAGQVEREGLLRHQAQAGDDPGGRRDRHTFEALALEHEPHGDGDQRGERRVEHEDVELLGDQR